MIKKAVAYIEKFIDQVIENKDSGDTPYDEGYNRGSRDVALNAREGLEGLEELYSLYEPSGDDWIEIAVSSDPQKIQALAISYSRSFDGLIEIRYEGAGNNIYKIIKEGGMFYRHKVLGGER